MHDISSDSTESNSSFTVLDYSLAGSRCTGCGTTGELHEYDGETWCSGCLSQRLAYEDEHQHDDPEPPAVEVRNSIGLDT
jgi:hypothetical protein